MVLTGTCSFVRKCADLYLTVSLSLLYSPQPLTYQNNTQDTQSIQVYTLYMYQHFTQVKSFLLMRHFIIRQWHCQEHAEYF